MAGESVFTDIPGGGVLSIRRRLYPKELAFSGVRFLKGQGVEIYKRVLAREIYLSVCKKT